MKAPILPNMQMLQGTSIDIFSFKSLIGTQCELIENWLNGALKNIEKEASSVLCDYNIEDDSIKLQIIIDHNMNVRMSITVYMTSYYLLNQTDKLYDFMLFLETTFKKVYNPTEKHVTMIKNYITSVLNKKHEIYIDKFNDHILQEEEVYK